MSQLVSKHFTRNRAFRVAVIKNRDVRNRGRSSGWSGLDYTVVPTNRLFRRWGVKVRSR